MKGHPTTTRNIVQVIRREGVSKTCGRRNIENMSIRDNREYTCNFGTANLVSARISPAGGVSTLSTALRASPKFSATSWAAIVVSNRRVARARCL